MAIPDFREDGYLPIGVHKATEAEVRERFGSSTLRRMMLMERLADWLSLARTIKAQRFLVDGSFATIKVDPNDVDCVIWLPQDFIQQFEWGRIEAVTLFKVMESRSPKELFGAFVHNDWDEWIQFFSRVRGRETILKGMVEVQL